MNNKIIIMRLYTGVTGTESMCGGTVELRSFVHVGRGVKRVCLDNKQRVAAVLKKRVGGSLEIIRVAN